MSAGRAPDAAIAVNGLERCFGERIALAEVTFELEEGQTLAVLGANGAGKTTLLRVLAGLLRPHGGEVHVLGARLPGESWQTHGRIGYLGHDPLLYRELSARQNLGYYARLHAVKAERVDELLEQVDVAARADEPMGDLSRGMIQRVAVARAVLHDPELLLLDEPRAGLDPAAAALLEPLVGRQSGRTRVLVTHIADAAVEEADLVLGLRGGRPEFATRAEEVGPDRIRELYR
jgi:heme ABC exporter ATP-binding subunit CcmA